MTSTQSIMRDSMIEQARQERITRDTLILQKVNHAHREGFKLKFPGQVEHCMRLTAERLQGVLTKKPADLTDPATWTATAEEIARLSEALYYLTQINKDHPVQETV